MFCSNVYNTPQRFLRSRILDKLNAEIGAAVKAPDVQKRLLELGAEPDEASGSAYAQFARSEASKWAAVVAKAGLAP